MCLSSVELTAQGCKVDYLVDCTFCPHTQRLFLVGGSFEGAVSVMHVNLVCGSSCAMWVIVQHGIEPALSMFGGNTSTVRCVDWNTEVCLPLLTFIMCRRRMT